MQIGNYIIRWVDIIDILLSTLLFYFVLKFILRSNIRGVVQLLVFLLLFFLLLKQLKLTLLSWIWDNFLIFLPLALIIIFQPEIRYALLRESTKRVYHRSIDYSSFTAELLKAVMLLAKDKVGAILVLERDVNLDEIIKSGIKIEADFSVELVYSIFLPSSLLHDGAAIIRGVKVEAVGCRLPLSKAKLPVNLGMRHRAALGISEETDALAIVTSEEKGTISVAHKGRLFSNIEEKELTSLLGI